MTFRYICSLAIAGLLATSLPAYGEEISINYKYQGDTGVSLASMIGGPLSVAEFSDGRSVTDKHSIEHNDNASISLPDRAPAALVKDTFYQALQSSDANLADDSALQLRGNLLEMQIADNGDGLEVLIRCELSLNNQGRNAWQSVVFSRTQTDSKDINEALSKGLDRLVSELFMDDYFLMELGIF
ncbi:hypothetical protein [Pseudohongiella spirulinae]|uniref:Lipid/polyisoprenoid-binding YceI-like domain-containing protein n=1 Tax=Pseudohongiella spirulinae TaxID=1249552 RepID=A0A0S2KFK0_9GAMM|nr:hypothetical protein [Pseudohongiella spirulinae]ALO47110.1 hypothetical protein PS2015_2476 [Pseudohongiella spirulinae]